jgi:SAM-dependent methyltransferase
MSTVVTKGTPEGLRAYLRDYYGRVLTGAEDLEKKACCADDTTSRFSDILRLIPREVRLRNYGCGCPIPREDLSGLSVLDLGSGAGLDCFVAAKLVGEAGRVQGVDMTDEQLEVARRNIEPVMRAYGFSRPNVAFHKGYIETAEAIESGTIDLVISDCVINLSPLKDQVFRTAYRVLKEGGEVMVSDIVADRRVPEAIRNDPKLVAECLGGALYEDDLMELLEECGFRSPRTVARVTVEEDVAGVPIRFYSTTIRAFKLSVPLDRREEDYGQVATYRGNCDAQRPRFALDDAHLFEAGRPRAVSRSTARILSETRLARYFDVTAEREHLGPFRDPLAGTAAPGAALNGRCC